MLELDLLWKIAWNKVIADDTFLFHASCPTLAVVLEVSSLSPTTGVL